MSKKLNRFYPRIAADGTCDVVKISYGKDDDSCWLNGVYQAIGNGCDVIAPVFCTAVDGTSYAVLVDEEGLLRMGCKPNEKLSECLRQLAMKKANLTRREAEENVPLFYGTGLFAVLDEAEGDFVGWTSKKRAEAFLSDLVS